MKVNNMAVNNLTDLRIACHKLGTHIIKATGWSSTTVTKYINYPENMNWKHKRILAEALETTVYIVDRVVKMQIERGKL